MFNFGFQFLRGLHFDSFCFAKTFGELQKKPFLKLTPSSTFN